MDPIKIKLLVVGDEGVGKRSMLWSYYQNDSTDSYKPSIFDNNHKLIEMDGQTINLGLWDTSGQQNYSMLRTLTYTNKDIFIILYSVTEKATLKNAVQLWYPEIRKAAPQAIIYIVGNKIDLREKQLSSNDLSKVEGVLKQVQEGICSHQQCSALTHFGVKQIIDKSISEVLKSKNKHNVLTPVIDIEKTVQCTTCHLI